MGSNLPVEVIGGKAASNRIIFLGIDTNSVALKKHQWTIEHRKFAFDAYTRIYKKVALHFWDFPRSPEYLRFVS